MVDPGGWGWARMLGLVVYGTFGACSTYSSSTILPWGATLDSAFSSGG